MGDDHAFTLSTLILIQLNKALKYRMCVSLNQKKEQVEREKH